MTTGSFGAGRLYMEGRSSEGQYTLGSKTGPPRDLPIQGELAAEFKRVKRAHADAGLPLGQQDFWISAQRKDVVLTKHQASNWRERDFRPVARQVAVDFPQFAELRTARAQALSLLSSRLVGRDGYPAGPRVQKLSAPRRRRRK